jgi:hypothetical protein
MHHPLAIILDVVSGAAVLAWWLGAYEVHIGTIATTLVIVWNLIQIAQWMRKR